MGAALILACAAYFLIPKLFGVVYNRADATVSDSSDAVAVKDTTTSAPALAFDTAAYDKKLLALANLPPLPVPKQTTATTAVGAVVASSAKSAAVSPSKPLSPWPVKAAYPKAGALLPFNRIIAYYGNFYSKGMGVLGQYPQEEMLSRLNTEVQKWKAIDPSTPVVPAIDYIAVTAQGSPGTAKKYRLRMPDDQIEKAIAIADKIHGIVILEIQPGLSTFEDEIPQLEKYLKMPQVHLALDPEFSMKSGAKPGTEIGTLDAADANWAANYLANLVRNNNLPPKILILHRFTKPMITNYKKITPLAEVQIIMDMDGWGSPAKKFGTYTNIVAREPVQFTGFKLFYKNDLRAPSTRMLTPQDLMALSPQPIFVQYQ